MYSIILAGGSGTRLFPLSRKGFPKQFLKIIGNESLFQKTLKRSLSIVSSLEKIIIVTNKHYCFYVKDNIKEVLSCNADIKDCHVILEPEGRNTAPAITLAVRFLLDKLKVEPNEVVFVCPSDHLISPDEEFKKYVLQAYELAQRGYIITFGIPPSRPETGYGYIEKGKNIKEDSLVYSIKRFHEKPDYDTAMRYVNSGNYYWNSGIFVFTINTFLEELEKYSPHIYSFVKNCSFDELVVGFGRMPNISIDYAIMEKTDRGLVLPVDIMWSDIGSFDSLYDVFEKNKDGNVLIGNVLDIDTKDSLVIASDRFVSTVDVNDLIIVETDDVVLVAKRGEGEKIRSLVEKLKERKETFEITETHTVVHRPWGRYMELERSDRYRIKRIVVNPGEALSLQLHYHRSEHWIVVRGTAKVILEDTNREILREMYVHENESVFIPKTTKHRLINPGKVPLEIIEVQVGEYLGEDDIIRYDDEYDRNYK